MRASGILLPVSSLPSEYGIGAFDRSAFDFVDTLVRAGQKYWQILLRETLIISPWMSWCEKGILREGTWSSPGCGMMENMWIMKHFITSDFPCCGEPIRIVGSVKIRSFWIM